MTRIRLVVAACLVAGIVLIAPMSSYALASQRLTTTFTTDSSSGDGYQATFTITNGTSVAVGQWSVGIVLPAGAQVSNPVGARIAVSGQQVTAANPDGSGRLAPGASATFSFTVHGGAAPPFVCVTNGQPCPSTPPAATPPPTPAPTPTPTPTGPPGPTAPAPTPTPAPTPPTSQPAPATPPAMTQPPATPTPTPTSGPSPAG